MRMCTEFGQLMELIYLYKVFYDHGKTDFVKYVSSAGIDEDYYYDVVFAAIENAADMVETGENVYARHGYHEDDEVNIFSFSCEEMRKYFKIAHKLHRLNGGGGNNPYISGAYNEVRELMNFHSYSFDCVFSKKRKRAALDVLWGYDFTMELWMVIWIVRVMDMFREHLPELQAEYRRVRREKRCRPKGGKTHAA